MALEQGCKVIGYTVWSFLDNFEWDDGFAVKFGLYRVDFDSPQKTRRIKTSGLFFKDFLGKIRELDGGLKI
ncbi:hypothetical protein OESDEN_00742 [Oesophagostomum dentatum]|uniref:Glycosyl hydrolase, family 1 n=1 Tax=Oesophagostomum dentatum TaxID=61180 RepID=A0A0B1TP07_OESDE|nr:hypothetical protein OESDEN_00742 [Oesophagostomum dentatum]